MRLIKIITVNSAELGAVRLFRLNKDQIRAVGLISLIRVNSTETGVVSLLQ